MSGIRVELQLEDGSFTSGVLRAGQTVKQFRQELARVNPHYRDLATNSKHVERSIRKADVASRGLLQTWRDVAVVAGAATLAFRGMIGSSNGLVGQIIKVNAEMERLQYQMQGMSVSADPIREAAASVEWLRKKATEAPFSLNQMANSFVKLKATGVDPMTKSMQAVMDGIAAFGGTDEHLHRVTLGIVQMSGKSVIQMEEMRQQLGESMPNAMRLMARSMGVSVAELTKAISTGRVESSAALDAFYNELERTYGGEAQRMMETFSGQVSQLQANLQILATGEGLKGFFEEQKSALQELNAFLQTDRAKDFAKKLGEGLSSVVNTLRVVVETIYDFRTELVTVGKMIAAGIGLRVLTGAFVGLSTALNFARMRLGAFAGQMAAGSSSMLLGVRGLIAGQHAATSMGLAAVGARTAFTGLVGTLSAVAPWFVLLGGAISIAAGRFGGLSEKTKEAYEELKKYGAESKKQAIEITNNRETQLRDLQAAAKSRLDAASANVPSSDSSSQFGAQNFRRLESQARKVYAAATKDVENFMEEKAGLIDRAEKDEQDNSLSNYKKYLDSELRESSVSYRTEQSESDKRQQKELDGAESNARQIHDIKKKYLEEQAARQEKQIRIRLELIDKEMKALREKRKQEGGTDEFKSDIDRQADYLNGKRAEIAQKLRDVGKFGIKLISNIEDDETKIKRATKILDGLQAEVKGLQAELLGGSSAMSKLQFKISRGDFGAVWEGGEAVKHLHEQLLAATEQKETLDELMKGRNDLESDLASAENKVLEERLELESELAGNLKDSDGDKIRFRLARGLYPGLGSMSNIEKGITGLTGVTNILGESVNQLGVAMRENTFGQSTLDSIRAVQEAMSGLSTTANGVVAGGFMGIKSGSAGSFDPTKIPREMVEGIKAAAAELQISAVDLATVISYETGGTFDPTKRGPTTQHGQHRGLIQFGEPQAKRFGVDWNDPTNSQLGADGAIVKYLRASGFKNGMGLDDLYSTINAGAPGLFNRSDANNGGAPGSVADKVRSMGDHKAKAEKLLGTKAPIYDPVQIRKDALAVTEDGYKRANQLVVDESLNRDLTGQVELKRMLEDLIGKQAGANVKLDGAGKNEGSVMDALKTGKFGPAITAESKTFKEILEVAKKLDETETRITESKKARRTADAETKRLDEERLEILDKIAQQDKLMADPNYRGPSEGFRRLQRELDQYTADVKKAYGTDSEAYKEALDRRAEMLGEQRGLDVSKRRVELNAEMRDVRDNLLSQGGLRDVQYKRDLARIDQLGAEMRQAGIAEIEITRQVEEAKDALRQQYMRASNPVTEQMQQWSQLGENLMASSTGWMDSIAGGITGLITGTGDLKSAFNSVISSIVDSYVKNFISNSFGSKASGGASKLGGKGAGPAGVSPLSMFGVKHTGGIAGMSGGSARLANPDIFNQAPKFHTGGIAGFANSMPKLARNEVPIIAKKKEGIFTPEQMAAMAPIGSMGGSGAISIAAPITIHGSSGSPEQNDDLAKKMSMQMEGTMRGVVVDEIRRQQRPGNMMNNRRGGR